MPNDNINRSIAKAAGELSATNYDELTYEGYGPNGSAIIVKTLTDNKNRTVDFVRTTMRKHGGELGNAGCVSFSFATMGVIVIERTVDLDEDTVMEYALDAGADDVITEDDAYVVNTSVSAFSEVRKYLEEKGLKFFSAGIEMVPQNKLTLTGEDLAKFERLIDALEDLDDVQDVYHNVDLPDDEEE
jgi:YebC/PmpR family DNA-binding regulatory protein